MHDDDIEPEEDEGANTCPVCNAGMATKCLQSKTDPRHDIFWAKYGYQCEECGHQGDTWEVLGD
jgi:C4-type Zn-finger protein